MCSLLRSNTRARSAASGCPGDMRQPATDLAPDPSEPTHHFSSAGPHNYSPATSPSRAAVYAAPARRRSDGGGRRAQPPPRPPVVRARHAGSTGRPRRPRPPEQQERRSGCTNTRTTGNALSTPGPQPVSPPRRPGALPRGGRALWRHVEARSRPTPRPGTGSRQAPEIHYGAPSLAPLSG
jgi:hypothetical protein